MAVTLTAEQLRDALRLGDSTEETAQATRLLAYATEAISHHLGDAYATAPDVVVNEAAIRLAGYLFDQPYTNPGPGFANALRNSGAGAILLPYRMHRAGSVAGSETAAVGVPATGGLNATQVQALIDAAIANLPDAGVDQTARDSAAANAAAIAALDIPPAYVLPAAAAGVRGGVQAVTNDLIDADTSTGVFGWMISHVKRVVTAVVPAWARASNPPIAAGEVTRLAGLPSFPLWLDGDNLPWTDRVHAKRAVVTHNSATYLCILATTGKARAETEPGIGTAWQTYWALIGHATVAVSGNDATARTQAMQAAAAAALNADAIARQNDRMTDLHAGPPATGWATANDAQGGIVAGPTDGSVPDQAFARAASGWTPTLTGRAADERLDVVRVPKDTPTAQARVRMQERASSLTYDSPLHGDWQHIGVSADDAWDYYTTYNIIGSGVGALTLQLTGSAVHVGGSKFAGELTGSIANGVVKVAALAAAVAARLLPASGGGVGKFLGWAGNPAAVAWVDAPSSSMRWYEMGRYFSGSGDTWTVGTALDMELRSDGMAKFATAALLRAAVGARQVPMVVLQRSTDDQRVIGLPLVPNFSDPDAADDYHIDFYFQTASGTERVEVRFATDALKIVPYYTDPGTVRFDLAVLA